MGWSPWGHKELDTTEQLHFHFSLACIGEGNGNPLQCSCLENPRDGGAWWAAVYGVAQSLTRLKWLSSSSSSHYPQWFWSPRKSVTLSMFSPFICHEVMGLDVMIFIFWVLSFKPAFSLSSFSFISWVPLHFQALNWYHLHIWGCWYFSWKFWIQLVSHAAWHFACSKEPGSLQSMGLQRVRHDWATKHTHTLCV